MLGVTLCAPLCGQLTVLPGYCIEKPVGTFGIADHATQVGSR